MFFLVPPFSFIPRKTEKKIKKKKKDPLIKIFPPLRIPLENPPTLVLTLTP